MNKFQRLWAPGLASSLLLMGCAGDAQKPRARTMADSVVTTSPCAGPEARVNLNQVRIPAPPASASIQVNPDSVRVNEVAGGVRWTIAGNRYVFADDGITFKAPVPAGPASSAITADRSDFWWCFNASPRNATWNYTIRFYDKNDTTVPPKIWSCDPIIVNFDSLMAATPRDVPCT